MTDPAVVAAKVGVWAEREAALEMAIRAKRVHQSLSAGEAQRKAQVIREMEADLAYIRGRLDELASSPTGEPSDD